MGWGSMMCSGPVCQNRRVCHEAALLDTPLDILHDENDAHWGYRVCAYGQPESLPEGYAEAVNARLPYIFLRGGGFQMLELPPTYVNGKDTADGLTERITTLPHRYIPEGMGLVARGQPIAAIEFDKSNRPSWLLTRPDIVNIRSTCPDGWDVLWHSDSSPYLVKSKGRYRDGLITIYGDHWVNYDVATEGYWLGGDSPCQPREWLTVEDIQQTRLIVKSATWHSEIVYCSVCREHVPTRIHSDSEIVCDHLINHFGQWIGVGQLSLTPEQDLLMKTEMVHLLASAMALPARKLQQGKRTPEGWKRIKFAIEERSSIELVMAIGELSLEQEANPAFRKAKTLATWLLTLQTHRQTPKGWHQADQWLRYALTRIQATWID
jgi:hypothetical protein